MLSAAYRRWQQESTAQSNGAATIDAPVTTEDEHRAAVSALIAIRPDALAI
jgi:hypothetical protein